MKNDGQELKIYHTIQEFELKGLERFIQESKLFLNGKDFPPLCKVFKKQDLDNKHLIVAFSSDLMLLAINDSDKFIKPFEVILKYGFRGYSTGGKNGLFYIRKQDIGLFEAKDKLYKKQYIEANRFLLPSDEKLIKSVKAVWHSPNGERLVGLWNTENDRIFMLDFARY